MQKKKSLFARLFPFCWQDFFTSFLILMSAWICCMLLQRVNTSDGFSSPIFVLAVLLISRFTNGYLFGMIASILGVVCVNLVFTYPYWHVNFTLTGYPITFLAFLTVSIMTCALTTQAKQQALLRAENEKEKMRTNLLRSVSHDIRTPLTSIVGSTSAVIEHPDLPLSERQQLLEDVRDEAQWLIRVVENLLSITRIGNDQARIEKNLEAVEEVLAEVLRKFRKRFPQIQFITDIPSDPLFVPMDPMLIEQVLSNLLENAVLHGKTTTQIRLSVSLEKNRARFSVIDNGTGISKAAQQKLFDGTMKHNETTSGDGKRNMGLGLSVCLAIIRAHGGDMAAHNLDNGAEFYFWLPLQED